MFERTIQLKIAIIPGTRPEIIKMSPVIRECEGGLESFTQHTDRQISLRKDRARARSGPGGGNVIMLVKNQYP